MITLVIVLFSCNSSDTWKLYSDQKGFLNLHDSVEYMGMNVCKECHFDIYQTFLRTGMGMSFDSATRNKSAAVIGEDSILYDPYNNLYYKPYWQDDILYVKELRIQDSMEAHSRTEKISWVIGSGQHTNSHIYMSGGYAYQVPFTYYTQDKKFDFPPGFEHGNNSRFSRKIGLECMSCHNGFPDVVLGSENKYNHIPDGIDCERCHGPGEIHVKLKKSGFLIDTAKYIDYSIVNPAKLSPELQIDICARCHLQGTMVLKPGKSFYDYKPGMHLTEVMDIFMPVFEGGKEDFIMASHFERLSQSECYINSNKEFSCNNCHNPHISVKETNINRYNKVCRDCHQQRTSSCTLSETKRKKKDNNCFVCHMRESTSRDIPHVKIHDHKITIPPTGEQLKEKRIFKGMAIINNSTPDSLTIARGYLLEYESYHPDQNYLDSASNYLQMMYPSDTNYYINALINLYFLQQDYQSIISLVEKIGVKDLLSNYLNTPDFTNYDGWTSYRIGQAFETRSSILVANSYYENAIKLAPYNLEFQTKYGGLLASMNKLGQAKKVFEFIILEDPNYTSSYVNLGFIHLNQREIQRAEEMFKKALKLDPDNIQALINLATIYFYKSDYDKAKDIIDRIKQIEPDNKMILELKDQLK
ncbi:MAG: tetratricopeptide repeat protein [Bacteroidales bacterium]|nr:tetratricopeptide repeat protein [Bacteroidales bacterium]